MWAVRRQKTLASLQNDSKTHFATKRVCVPYNTAAIAVSSTILFMDKKKSLFTKTNALSRFNHTRYGFDHDNSLDCRQICGHYYQIVLKKRLWTTRYYTPHGHINPHIFCLPAVYVPRPVHKKYQNTNLPSKFGWNVLTMWWRFVFTFFTTSVRKSNHCVQALGANPIKLAAQTSSVKNIPWNS